MAGGAGVGWRAGQGSETQDSVSSLGRDVGSCRPRSYICFIMEYFQ